MTATADRRQLVIKAWSLPFGKSVVRMIYTHTTRKICMALMKSFELKTASGSCIVGNYPFSATICQSFWKEGQLLRNISILEPKSNAAIHVLTRAHPTACGTTRFYPSRARLDPVVDGFGLAQPIIRVVFGPLSWHAVPA